MNHLLGLRRLRNRYFALRHGHSIANQQGIIVSHPDNGIDSYGLSDLGVSQVEQTLAGALGPGPDPLLLSSDFRRARESAEIARRVLGCTRPPVCESRLRERYFGSRELGPDSAYEGVWQIDAVDPDSVAGGMESANQVTSRVTALIAECERAYDRETILLISHGDALQLLQAAFLKRDAASHRALDHLHTAELRQLRLADE